MTDLEVAGTNLLVEDANGAELFGLLSENEFGTFSRWEEPGLRRELTVNGDGEPIVVHELADGYLSIDPGSPIDHEYGIPMSPLLDASYDGRTLRTLGNSERGLTLVSITGGSADSEVVSEEASQFALLVGGASPPRVLYNVAAGPLWSFDGEEAAQLADVGMVRAMPRDLSAVAVGERMLLAYQPTSTSPQAPTTLLSSGTVEVHEAGAVSIFGAPRSLRCPAGYTAEYPDICEFERVTPETTPGAVLDVDLAVLAGEPWLVTIVANVTDRCDTFAGHCFESLPCDCQYQRRGSAVEAELRITSLDDPSRSFFFRLGDYPYETVSVEASGSDDRGALVVAVAERQFTAQGSNAGTLIDFLVITP